MTVGSYLNIYIPYCRTKKCCKIYRGYGLYIYFTTPPLLRKHFFLAPRGPVLPDSLQDFQLFPVALWCAWVRSWVARSGRVSVLRVRMCCRCWLRVRSCVRIRKRSRCVHVNTQIILPYNTKH